MKLYYGGSPDYLGHKVDRVQVVLGNWDRQQARKTVFIKILGFTKRAITPMYFEQIGKFQCLKSCTAQGPSPQVLRIHKTRAACPQTCLSPWKTLKITSDLLWRFLKFKLQSVFVSYLCQFRSNFHIQRHFRKLEIKSFHLAPRIMGFYSLLMEILAPKGLTVVIFHPLEKVFY